MNGRLVAHRAQSLTFARVNPALLLTLRGYGTIFNASQGNRTEMDLFWNDRLSCGV